MISIELSLKNIDDAACEFIKKTKGCKIFAFYGEMGAGKTTFIKAICKALGVTGTVNSPTFALVNEYNANAEKIYHFDFYRINKPEEALDIGCEEYFASGEYCFIEWPEKAETVLPENICKVTIREITDGNREVIAHLPVSQRPYLPS